MLQHAGLGRFRPRRRRADGLDALARQIDTQADATRRQIDEQGSEAAITRAVGDNEAFRRALQAYVERFKDAPRHAPGFARTLGEARLWNEVDEFERAA